MRLGEVIPPLAIAGSIGYAWRPHQRVLDAWDQWRLRRMYRGEKFPGTIVLHRERLVTSMTMEIVAKFVGRNRDDKNQGGLVVQLKSSNGGLEEFAAIGVERTNTAHPDVPYRQKVDEVVADAEHTIEVINNLLTKYKKGELQ